MAVAPDGTLAACCNLWLDEISGTALFELVSTVPEHRRKGVARAMLLWAMRQMTRQPNPIREAWVVSDGDNPAATALYESAGMPIVRHDDTYTKPI